VAGKGRPGSIKEKLQVDRLKLMVIAFFNDKEMVNTN
jgi:hypothetical protein